MTTIYVSAFHREGMDAARRDECPPREAVFVSTNDTGFRDRLRGRVIDPEEVVLVDGYWRGRYAPDVEEELRRFGFDVDEYERLS